MDTKDIPYLLQRARFIDTWRERRSAMRRGARIISL